MKSVFVTGCTPGGIGHALAKEYHAKGLRVFATARRVEVLADLAALGIETLKLDVCDPESVRAAKDAVASKTGGTLDILVNNAGQAHAGVPSTDFDMDEVKNLYEVNVFGVMRTVQEFAPLLIASGDGRIVNIGSVVGIIPLPFNSSAYNSSKAALHSYSNTLRLELAPFNVQVTTVITGGVKTNMAMMAQKPLKTSSIYAPIADIIANRAPPERVEKVMPPEVYAKYVVAQSLKRTVAAWLWHGSQSWTVWFVDAFVGRTGFDLLCWYTSGLNKLKAALTSEKKQK